MDPAAPVIRVLDNGLIVEVRQEFRGNTQARLELPVGALDAPAHVAHLAEHLVAERIGRGAGVLELDTMGARSSAQTAPRRMDFTVAGRPEDVLRFVWLLRRSLEMTSFSDDELRAAAAAVHKEQSERARSLGHPGWVAWMAALRGKRRGVVDPLAIPDDAGERVAAFVSDMYRIDGAKLVVQSPYPPARIAPHVVALWEDAPPGRPKPQPKAHDEPPRGVARICVAGFEGASFVYVGPEVPASFDEDLVADLTEAFDMVPKEVRRRSVDGGSGVVKQVAVQHVRGVPLAEGWFFLAFADEDLPWETLERVGRDLIRSMWKIDPATLVHVAAARWYAAAVRAECAPPPARPASPAVTPANLPAPPPARLIVLVRGASACSQH